MTKINITRSQVAQLYVELTSDNLKEVFIVEGELVAEPEAVETAPVENAPEETVAPEVAPDTVEAPTETTPAAE